ncbi:MAG: TetR/AcrR family transcriptional regulator [Solirubrobacteraceae bacterium]
MATAPRASRRSTAEVRTLILDAAAELFAERGYAQTTMRAVAGRAGISLSVLYRQFPSKEGLFSATLLDPFLASFEQFAAAWGGQVENPWDDERLVGEFVRDLYGNLADHRHAVVTLLAAGEDSSAELLEEVRQGLAAGLTDLTTMAAHEADVRGWFSADTVRYSNALIIAMITGLALIRPWLVAQLGDDDAALLDAATRLAMYGMRLAPPG